MTPIMKYCLRIYPICIALVFAVLSCLTGCSGTTDGFQPTDNRLEQTDSPVLIRPADTPSVPDAGFYRGFASILPPDGDFESAYSKAAAHADFVNIWVGAPGAGYRDLAEYLGGGWGDTFVEELVRGNGMFPVINLSFIGRDADTGLLVLNVPAGKKQWNLSDAEFRNAYRQAAVDAVKASKPLYLSLGNEVNRWYEQFGADDADPNGFQHFVSLYEEIYDVIRELSPQTRIFCIFSREIVDENREADLSVLKMFDPGKLDVLAFTSYPFAVSNINNISNIPDDYYSRALDYLGDHGKPFGFTEICWSALESFGGEQAQAEFLNDVVSRLTVTRGVNLHMLAWWSLFDLEYDPHGTGLITRDGREKPVYDVWKYL